LEVGQVLVIPPPDPSSVAPGYKIIPDSELVYSPAAAPFVIHEFIQQQNGYLARYTQSVEDLDNQSFTGAQIVERVALQYSVNPRLLLAVLEFQSGWVTQENPNPEFENFPLGIRDAWRAGLYRQLAWAANNLNRGFYGWRVNAIGSWITLDGMVIPANPTVNAGTAGVQKLFSLLYPRETWLKVIGSDEGFMAVYMKLFGYPFDYTVEPLVPQGLRQPVLQLPFEPGITWAFTGGPHGSWGDGSAWGALDFAPDGEAAGCISSDAWVTAMGNGPILRAGNGEVIQEIETIGSPSDGYEQTGWVVLYMHIESRDRVQPGIYLHAGDHIGHPSCEGGVSNGTHVHIARKYNGEWIPADQSIPFVLDGWVSRGLGVEYDGQLNKDEKIIEAWDGISPENIINR
jgi:hypothetical protein